MKFNQNLQNLLFLTFFALLLGLGCSGSETVKKTPERKRTEEKEFSTNQPSNLESNKMTNNSENEAVSVDKSSFKSVLTASLAKRGLKKSDICNENDSVQLRILNEYGAVFLTTATPPPSCMFTSAEAVNSFQNKIGTASESIAGANIELQTNAMKALLEAREEAKAQGLDITPKDGAEGARRGFDDTLRLWASRFDPACNHWKDKGKLTAEQINKLKALPINEQVKEVLELEKQEIYFNKDFTGSILYSVAAPGTSQHLSMLAFDAVQFGDPKVRKIMRNHGWFRTVKNDKPHFTFLGVKEEELKNMGLKMIETNDGEYWVPNV